MTAEQGYDKLSVEVDHAREASLASRGARPATLLPTGQPLDCTPYLFIAQHLYGKAQQAYTMGNQLAGDAYLFAAEQQRMLAMLCETAATLGVSAATDAPSGQAAPPMEQLQARREQVRGLRDPNTPPIVEASSPPPCSGYLGAIFERLELAHHAYTAGDTEGGDTHSFHADIYTVLYKACVDTTNTLGG